MTDDNRFGTWKVSSQSDLGYRGMVILTVLLFGLLCGAILGKFVL